MIRRIGGTHESLGGDVCQAAGRIRRMLEHECTWKVGRRAYGWGVSETRVRAWRRLASVSTINTCAGEEK